jgi:anhydro-N-acetylmuramic acid kinase
LTSFLHYHLFRDPKRTFAVQNIGGISNVTVIPAGCNKEKILAFDTGPGNMIIDGLIKRGSGKNFDRNGSIAGSGEVDKKLLKKLLSHPYLRKSRPRQQEGRNSAELCLKRSGKREAGGGFL